MPGAPPPSPGWPSRNDRQCGVAEIPRPFEPQSLADQRRVGVDGQARGVAGGPQPEHESAGGVVQVGVPGRIWTESDLGKGVGRLRGRPAPQVGGQQDGRQRSDPQ